jgi:peroxiredoxin
MTGIFAIRRLMVLFAGLFCLMPSVEASIRVGDTAPDFPMTLINGGQISLSQLRGQVVLLNFWATWCGPCRLELPALNGIYRDRHDRGLAIVGIDVDTDPGDARAFLAKYPAQFSIVLDIDGKAGSKFGLDGMPMTILLDRLGIVRWVHRGFSRGDDQEYAHRVDALLKGN